MRKRKQNFEFAAEQMAKLNCAADKPKPKLSAKKLSEDAHRASAFAEGAHSMMEHAEESHSAAAAWLQLTEAHDKARRLHMIAHHAHHRLGVHDTAAEHLKAAEHHANLQDSARLHHLEEKELDSSWDDENEK